MDLKEKNKKINLNIYKAVLMLEKSSSDVFFMLKKTKIEISSKVPTACVGFNEAKKLFIMTINEDWALNFNTYNLAAIIEHELLHVVLWHCLEYKDVKPEQRHALNIAQDAIINDIGHQFRKRENLNDELKRGVFFDRLRDELNQHDLIKKAGFSFYDFTSAKITSKQLFELVLQLPDENKNNMTTTDEHGQAGEQGQDDGQGQGASQGMSKQAQDIIKEISQSDEAKKIIEEIAKGEGLSEAEKNNIKAIGKKNADFEVILRGYYKAERIKNFKNAVNNFLATTKNSLKKSTLKRPSRRFSGSPYGKIKQRKNKIKLCIDTSGSQFNDECFEKINISINNALDLGFEVDLISGDTKKTFEKKNLTKNFDFSQVMKGGGGTELSFFFEDKDDAQTSYVIVTDGYFDRKDIPSTIAHNKILMLSTSDMNPIFDFRTLEINK